MYNYLQDLQKKYFQTGATRDVEMLKNVLINLRVEILNRENDIYEALYKDFKKPQLEGYYDIDIELFSNLTQKEFVYIMRNNKLDQLKQLNNE